jgi:hypothetical protein
MSLWLGTELRAVITLPNHTENVQWLCCSMAFLLCAVTVLVAFLIQSATAIVK